jgi:hypothetical protein
MIAYPQPSILTAYPAGWNLIETTPGGSDESIESIWCGAVDHTSFWVRGKVTGGTSVRLAVATNTMFTNAVYFGPVAPTEHMIVSIRATGLSPTVQYFYAFEIDGTLKGGELERGRVKTFPTPGQPASFVFGSASCAGLGSANETLQNAVSNRPVFDTIRLHNTDLWIHTGDLHYRNISSNNPASFRQAFDDVLTFNGVEGLSARQAQLYRSTALAYVWDDHDFGSNDSDKNSASRPAARMVYRERVPHYGLPAQTQDSAAETDRAIYQAWTMGRVRFIMTDLRSCRSPKGQLDDENKIVMGAEQEAWFYNELATATEPVICWINTYPWIAAPSAGADHWGGYSTERARIAAQINALGVGPRMFIVAGDMHGLAIDNGTNNQWGGFPVFHFASYDATGSTKGGPYSHGTSSGRDRYGLVTVQDQGEDVVITGVGYNGSNVVMSYSFSIDAEGTVIPPPPEDRIEGVVRLEGNPVSGAKVFLLNQTTDTHVGTVITNSQGQYSFQSLSNGVYRVFYSYDGGAHYVQGVKDITVAV